MADDPRADDQYAGNKRVDDPCPVDQNADVAKASAAGVVGGQLDGPTLQEIVTGGDEERLRQDAGPGGDEFGDANGFGGADGFAGAKTAPYGARHAPFVHLHAHSAYSLLEGAIPLARLIDLAIKDGQPALAITDRNNLFGALEFSETAATNGLQPIMGCALAVHFDEFVQHGAGHLREDEPALVLLATSDSGFANLVKLVSHAYMAAEPGGSPTVSLDDLKRFGDGLIALSGGPQGPLDRTIMQGDGQAARQIAIMLAEIFGNRFYVELQRHRGRALHIEPALLEIAYELELPIVATNQPYFASPEDHEAHDALICIAAGCVVAQDDRRQVAGDHYFRTADEMVELFGDLPEAIENTIEIARRCAVRAFKRTPILPRFAALSSDSGQDQTLAAEAAELERQTREGLAARFEQFEPAAGFSRQDYVTRLESELSVISQMNYPGYFLIVADFIKWAKERRIPVGPGRGSGAGSLVAWALTITDIDPMRFTLLFERFLNPERVSMPDFDIDFCQDRREEVIAYVQDKYGREQVAQIITFGSLQARAVLRDVGRVLQMPYGQVDRLCKLVPNNPANPITLARAVESEPRLQEARSGEDGVDQLIAIAMRLEGLYRHASTHAAGIVIADRPLDELVPIYRDPRSDMPVTQYNMKWIEQAGLVKFDFLGLKTLTVLETTVSFVEQTAGERIDLATIPLDDQRTFDMLTRGETVGVFQLESQGMRKALLGMRPDRFEDIIALLALYRPGPMDNIPTYIARKHGEEEPDYIHPLIEPVLTETYGVIIYQEQVMQIAQILSGYSLGEADILRRAMGKKIRSEMNQQRERFVSGASDKGIDKTHADLIFDLLAKFADYGFNKSHAAAYALVSYQTAYLKANYPVAFTAATMALDIGNTDKLAEFYREAERLGIAVSLPSVQTSFAGFAIADDAILYALAAIKGVGEQAAQHIVEVRQAGGQFANLTGFFNRIDITQVNRKALESLIVAGAFDCFAYPREQILGGLERLVDHAARSADNRARGQSDMFGAGAREDAIILAPVESWQLSEKLHREFLAAGFYLSAHPLDEYRPVLERLRVQYGADFTEAVKNGATAGRLAGTIASRQERRTRTGNRMGIVTVSDPSGQYEAVIFSEGLAQYRELLEPGTAVVMLVDAEMRTEGVSIRIQTVQPLEQITADVRQDLRVYVRDDEPVETVAEHLKCPGDGRVSFVIVQNMGEREIEIALGGRYQVSPKIAGAMKAVPGVLDVELV